jgi:flavin reductase (DIM6/NTAB) family NADH-FMN oxidoreductase RutF
MQRTDINLAIQQVKQPQKVVVAFVQIEPGRFNPITLEWFMRTSIEPPMFAVSIGQTRFSYECLQEYRLFNLCFPSPEQAPFVRLSGTVSGRDSDKMDFIKDQWFKGRFAGLPILKGAAANFECEVISQVQSGDHTIYAGKVKYAWLGEARPFTLADL